MITMSSNLLKKLIAGWLVLTVGIGVAAASAPYTRYIGAENGQIYAVGEDGSLTLFRHLPETSAPGWVEEAVSPAGGGWNLEHVIYNASGVIYGAFINGSLKYYRDTSAGGIHSWASGTGNIVSLTNIWAEPQWLLGDTGGLIYAINRAGQLYYFRHGGAADTTWISAAGTLIGTNWNYKLVVPGRNGVLYGISHDGTIYYNHDLARDGTVNWAYPTNVNLGNGWGRFQHVVSTGNGHLYGVEASGAVFYYHVSVTGGVADWTGSNPITPINPGASAPPKLYQGIYCWPLSAAPGANINFMVSHDGPAVLRFVRMIGTNSANPDEIEMAQSTISATVQPAWNPPARRGCGWATNYTLTIPGNWPSGMYSAHCYPSGTDDSEESFEATFVVKPSTASTAKLAVVANVNTWNAYNDQWGGSHYSDNRANLSFLRPANPLVGSARKGLFHLVAGELWVPGWLASIEGGAFRPDILTDLDLHNGFDLRPYRCLILSTHPEYWTDEMYDRLSAYLEGGGCLLYLGGNGIYERVSYSADHATMMLDGGIDQHEASLHSPDSLFRLTVAPNRNERNLLGVATAHCGVEGGGYTVIRTNHPFLRGVTPDATRMIGNLAGLATGPRAFNYNGKAAGLETDNLLSADLLIGSECATLQTPTNTGVALNPLPRSHVVLSKAYAVNGGGDAEMTYYPHRGGGFVLSAGSVTFGGCLFADTNLAALLQNALQESCRPPSTITSFTNNAPGSCRLSFRSRPGSPLVLERAFTLGSPWNTIRTLDLGDDENTQFTDLITSDSTSFFRIRHGPF